MWKRYSLESLTNRICFAPDEGGGGGATDDEKLIDGDGDTGDGDWTEEDEAALNGESDDETDDGGGTDDDPEGVDPDSSDDSIDDGGKADSKAEARINDLTYQQRSTQEKLDLALSDPTEFARRYPDEAPGTKKDESGEDLDSLVIKSEDGKHPYEGMTIAQVKEENPASYRALVFNHQQEQKSIADAETAVQEKASAALNKENGDFRNMFATEVFGKTDDLSETETKQVDQVHAQVIDFMEKTNRLHVNVSDAYALMTMDERLKNAATGGAKDMITSLKKPVVPAAGSGGGGDDDDADDMTKWDDTKLEAYIDSLSDKEARDFYKSSPPVLVKKFPDLPWG